MSTLHYENYVVKHLDDFGPASFKTCQIYAGLVLGQIFDTPDPDHIESLIYGTTPLADATFASIFKIATYQNFEKGCKQMFDSRMITGHNKRLATNAMFTALQARNQDTNLRMLYGLTNGVFATFFTDLYGISPFRVLRNEYIELFEILRPFVDDLHGDWYLRKIFRDNR